MPPLWEMGRYHRGLEHEPPGDNNRCSWIPRALATVQEGELRVTVAGDGGPAVFSPQWTLGDTEAFIVESVNSHRSSGRREHILQESEEAGSSGMCFYITV